jgi:hypothetical protein
MWYAWRTLADCAGVEEAELLACFEGVRMMESRCCGPGILESDCANVVASLKTSEINRSTLWSVIAETQALLRGRPDIGIRKISRWSNKVAHSLAQLGKSACGVLDKAGLPCVADLLAEDCMNSMCTSHIQNPAKKKSYSKY